MDSYLRIVELNDDVKMGQIAITYYKVPFTTGLQFKVTLSNRLGYEKSSFFTLNLLIIPSKPGKLEVSGSKKTQ